VRIEFKPTAYEPGDCDQVFADEIKAFVDGILPKAFATAKAVTTPGGIFLGTDTDKLSMIQGISARILDYIAQSLSGDDSDLELVRQMRENLFEI